MDMLTNSAMNFLQSPAVCNRTMYGVWCLYFVGILLIPGVGLRLGWKERLQDWIRSRSTVQKWLCQICTYPFRILLDQAACRDVYLPQVCF